MPGSQGEDLAAMLAALASLVGEQEAPILRSHGLTMWEYVILGRLDRARGQSQSELARRSRRDPTRLIVHLDDLEGRGLITRDVDPADRRRRVVRLSDAGSSAVNAARDEIRAMEREFVLRAGGSPDDLRNAVEAVLGLPADEDDRPLPTS